jgi:hypothetical protein
MTTAPSIYSFYDHKTWPDLGSGLANFLDLLFLRYCTNSKFESTAKLEYMQFRNLETIVCMLCNNSTSVFSQKNSK